MRKPNPKWTLAAYYLANGMNKTQVGIKLKVKRQTINNWLKKKEFRVMLRDAQKEHYEQSINEGVADSDSAVVFFRSVLSDTKADLRDRMAAAKVLLKRGTSMVENREILGRLSELEEKVAARDDVLDEISKS